MAARRKTNTKWGEGEAPPLLCFAVLAALAKQPMTLRKLAITLLSSDSAINKALIVLEDLGWIVKRADYKWTLRVVLAPMAVPLPNAHGGYPRIEQGTPGTEGVLGPNTFVPVRPEPRQAPKYGKPIVAVTPEEKAAKLDKLAQSWNVPRSLEAYGEIGLGKLGKCILCHDRMTPLQYGEKTICAICARGTGDIHDEARGAASPNP